MSETLAQTRVFAELTSRTLADMFDVQTLACQRVQESDQLETTKTLVVSILFTGTVYGEYLLAMDEEVAMRLIGLDPAEEGECIELHREDVGDAVTEMLNTIVGESITHLQESFSKLTITSPRIHYGFTRYPKFHSGMTSLETSVGTIECHFYLDLMRLDLAESYQRAMDSLMDVNTRLRAANQRLAEQQTQLVLSEKMASVGILASGVAHEINNPLFFVEANLTTMDDYVRVIEAALRLHDGLISGNTTADEVTAKVEQLHATGDDADLDFVLSDTQQLLAESREGIGRIKDIVQGLRDFSQMNKSGRIEADLNLIVRNTCDLISSQLPADCEIVTHCGDLPRIVCNVAEIGQVVSSILINAGEAVGDQGKISIRTSFADGVATLFIDDNGRGIDKEHLGRIFEPFFTTKDEGQGSGLGLSIAYGIIRCHQGSITACSELGRGTTIAVRLPVTAQPSNTVSSCS